MTPRPWRTWITRAKAVGHFTRHDKARAKHWPSCAVGEGLPGLTFLEVFTLPGKLQELGIEFNKAVNGDEVAQAEKIYKNIKQYMNDHAQGEEGLSWRKKTTPT